MGVEITVVRKEDVAKVWPRARLSLEGAAGSSNGRYDIYVVGNEVHSGNHDLWLVFDGETDELFTAFTTMVNSYPLRRVLTVTLCSGEEIYKHHEIVLNSLDEFAIQRGCSGVEFLDASGLEGVNGGFNHLSSMRKDFDPGLISKNVRIASPGDAHDFAIMWKKYMAEMVIEYKDSFEIMDTDVTEYSATRLFSSYANGGDWLGRCFFWMDGGSPAGFALIGEVPGEKNYDVVWEKPAWLSALYLLPEVRGKKAYREMYDVGKKLMKALGFSDILGTVPAGNNVSYRVQEQMGARAYSVSMQCSLEE